MLHSMFDSIANFGLDTLMQVVSIIIMVLIGVLAETIRRYTGINITERQRTALQGVLMRGIQRALSINSKLSASEAAVAGVKYAEETSPALVKRATSKLSDPRGALRKAAEALVYREKDIF